MFLQASICNFLQAYILIYVYVRKNVLKFKRNCVNVLLRHLRLDKMFGYQTITRYNDTGSIKMAMHTCTYQNSNISRYCWKGEGTDLIVIYENAADQTLKWATIKLVLLKQGVKFISKKNLPLN